MADDINKAINSGGYVIVPERAVDGVGRNAIYVYMTYNGQTGHQSWKISGGLNGGLMVFSIIGGLALTLFGGAILAFSFWVALTLALAVATANFIIVMQTSDGCNGDGFVILSLITAIAGIIPIVGESEDIARAYIFIWLGSQGVTYGDHYTCKL